MDFNANDGDNPLFPCPNSSPKLSAPSPYLSSFKSGSGSESSADAPKQLNCLHEPPIPPFLSKTYDLVEDSSLDGIISWGEKGDTFVVWNHLEFSRLILPRNFKHDNFSSFVRQLNTYGFRKIGTEKWEFMNEGFMKGQRNLLRRIQRRKSHQSPHVGSSIESGKPSMEAEIQCLRKERSSMMHELVQLQHQQCGTIQRVEVVKERLEASEKRQKQMVSFLGRVLRKPAFLASLKQARKEKSIDSHGPARKYIKHKPHEPGTSPKGLEPQPCNSVTPDYDVGDGLIFGADHMPSLVKGILPNEMAMVHGLSHMPKQGDSVPTLATVGSYINQEDVMIPQPQSLKGCSTNFPGDLIMEKSVSAYPIAGVESINTTDVWDMGCETSVGMSGLWDNHSNNNPLELGDTSELMDIWGIGSPQEFRF